MYLLFCCQDPDSGGLIDKPGKSADLYHTCYALSGLSSSQNHNSEVAFFDPVYYLQNSDNVLEETDPVYNVKKEKLLVAEQFFKEKPWILDM